MDTKWRYSHARRVRGSNRTFSIHRKNGALGMKICCVEGCGQSGAFTTRTRPTWCLDHLRQLNSQGGLTLLVEFTKPSDYLLTRCTRCGFEGHYRFEYVLDRLQAGEFVCRACYWRAWAKGAHAMSGCSDKPVDISTVKKNAAAHGYMKVGAEEPDRDVHLMCPIDLGAHPCRHASDVGPQLFAFRQQDAVEEHGQLTGIRVGVVHELRVVQMRGERDLAR